MRAKLFIVVLSALLVLGFTLTATAQVAHNVTAANTQLVYKGAREVLGGITFTANAPATTQGGSIYIVYTVKYTNAALGTVTDSGVVTTTPNSRSFTYANGMVLTVRGDGYATSAAWKISSISNINGNSQGQIVISVPSGLAVAAMDQISLDGIRADVSGMAVNAQVYASMSSIPSQANTYNPANIIVATVQPNFTVDNVEAGGGVVCANTSTTNPSLTITEGFAGAFVQHTAVGAHALPANARPGYGANANTQFTITVTGLPAGTELSWPASVTEEGVEDAVLLLTDVNDDGSVVTYDFATDDQAISDQNQEYFIISPSISIAGTTAVPGEATVQVQMGPIYSATSSSVPLFKPDIKNVPPDPFVTVTRCVTYLLFPYLVQGSGGYDTGIAIANTSFDSGVFPSDMGANAQSGGATLYYFKASPALGDAGTASGWEADDPLAFQITSVAAGDTWVGTMSSLNTVIPGFVNSQGYMIAKCQFQNAHGYGFVAYNLGQQIGAVQGYVANVILDPVTAGPRSFTTTLAGGESLGN